MFGTIPPNSKLLQILFCLVLQFCLLLNHCVHFCGISTESILVQETASHTSAQHITQSMNDITVEQILGLKISTTVKNNSTKNITFIKTYCGPQCSWQQHAGPLPPPTFACKRACAVQVCSQIFYWNPEISNSNQTTQTNQQQLEVSRNTKQVNKVFECNNIMLLNNKKQTVLSLI